MSSVTDNVKKLSKEDLLTMYEVEFEDYTDEALEIAEEEIKARGVALEKYYYNDLMGEKGPVNKRVLIQMIKSGDLQHGHLVKHEKDEKWSFVKDVDFTKKYLYNPFVENAKKEKSTYDKGDVSEKKSRAKVGTILLLINEILFITLTVIQMGFSYYYDDVESMTYSSVSLALAIWVIIVCISALKFKKWTYGWLMWFCIVGAIFDLGYLIYYLSPLNSIS